MPTRWYLRVVSPYDSASKLTKHINIFQKILNSFHLLLYLCIFIQSNLQLGSKTTYKSWDDPPRGTVSWESKVPLLWHWRGTLRFPYLIIGNLMGSPLIFLVLPIRINRSVIWGLDPRNMPMTPENYPVGGTFQGPWGGLF